VPVGGPRARRAAVGRAALRAPARRRAPPLPRGRAVARRAAPVRRRGRPPRLVRGGPPERAPVRRLAPCALALAALLAPTYANEPPPLGLLRADGVDLPPLLPTPVASFGMARAG